MTLPLMVRVFFAIDLPVAVKEVVGAYIRTLKKSSKSQAIRWTKSENLHITLQFLAEVESEHVTKLVENVRRRLDKEMLPLSIHFGRVQLFPSPYRPRVIVLDIGPQEQLSELARLIGEGISATNYPVEARPFRAHLTLGRIKHPHGLNLSFLATSANLDLADMAISEITLFRSQPQAEGSHYTVLDKMDLRVKKLAS